MSASLDFLVDLLDLEPIEVNIFRGAQLDEERQRVFGGQVAGQALMAAGRTVDHGRVHSLHSYFLRPGDPTVPILYEVDRIRDGRSFTTRRVVAIQHGRAIFNLETSFHDPEPGLEHQFPMPEVPPPEELPAALRAIAALEGGAGRLVRPAPPHRPAPHRRAALAPQGAGEAYQRLWIRADGTLPDDPLLHACIAAYASDMSMLDTVLGPHDVRWDDSSFMGATLDHCMWFHRPFRADDWMLFDMDSPAASGGRGLARGFLYDRQGRLCVSLVQEGLLRVRTHTPRRQGVLDSSVSAPRSACSAQRDSIGV